MTTTDRLLRWLVGILLTIFGCGALFGGYFIAKDMGYITPKNVEVNPSNHSAANEQQADVRRTTGQNKTLRFAEGDSVYGWRIVLDNGKVCDGGECYIVNAPTGGTVTSGVINPWDEEVEGLGNSEFSADDGAASDQTNVIKQNAANDTPYNLYPQEQIGHPSLYLETGVPCANAAQGLECEDVDSHTKHWVIELLPDTVAIVGGFTVDGVSDGVYKAIAGPGTLDTTVTDGFVAIIKSDWAETEFFFRVGQAIEFEWAHEHVSPLSGWTDPGLQ